MSLVCWWFQNRSSLASPLGQFARRKRNSFSALFRASAEEEDAYFLLKLLGERVHPIAWGGARARKGCVRPDKSRGVVSGSRCLVLSHGPSLAGLSRSFEFRQFFVDSAKRQTLFDLRDFKFEFLRKDPVDCWLLHDVS